MNTFVNNIEISILVIGMIIIMLGNVVIGLRMRRNSNSNKDKDNMYNNIDNTFVITTPASEGEEADIALAAKEAADRATFEEWARNVLGAATAQADWNIRSPYGKWRGVTAAEGRLVTTSKIRFEIYPCEQGMVAIPTPGQSPGWFLFAAYGSDTAEVIQAWTPGHPSQWQVAVERHLAITCYI